MKLSLLTQAIDNQIFLHEVELDKNRLSCTIVRPHTVKFAWLIFGDITKTEYYYAEVVLSQKDRMEVGVEISFREELITKKVFSKESK